VRKGQRHIITIDGPAGAGKSTISRLLARHLGYLYLDTGAMYRAVALAARRRGLNESDTSAIVKLANSVSLRFIGDPEDPKILLWDKDVSREIRTPEMDMLSSSVSKIPEVRQALVGIQRQMGLSHDLVAEGRDMGTVVFPHARDKFFLTASTEVRARRRYKERRERGEEISLDSVITEIESRDLQDSSRAVAPLRPSPEAIVIDTSEMDIGEVLEVILMEIRPREGE